MCFSGLKKNSMQSNIMQTTRLNKVNKILQDFSLSLLLEGIHILKRKVWYIVLLRLPGSWDSVFYCTFPRVNAPKKHFGKT